MPRHTHAKPVAPERLRSDIVDLVHRGLDVREFALAAARVIGRAVPWDGACVVTLDPATLLTTDHVLENALPDAVQPRYEEIEIREADFNKMRDLVRARRPVATLSAVTEGKLDRSLRHRELCRPNGFGGDELRTALLSERGAWGGMVLLRETGRADFTPAEADQLAALSEHLGEGLRRAMLLSALSGDPLDDADGAPGLLLLTDGNEVEQANRAAERWLAELGSDGRPEGPLPVPLRAVAERARSITGAGPGAEPVARVRVRTASGRWLLVRGSMLGDGPDARAVVILEPLSAPELAPLIADAYGLTARERAVTQLVAQGLPTSAIATRLSLSPYTVQDHLKSIFDKFGVGARGELVARLFFDHYAPRLIEPGAAAH